MLSPDFFNLFISDLPSIFDNSCNPITLNGKKLGSLLYADDLVILSETADGLQTALDKLANYCKTWNLTVNIKKSQIMIFNKSGRLIQDYPFKYDGKPLEVVDNYPYLGIIFTPSGSFTKAIANLCDKAGRAFFAFRKYENNTHVTTTFKLFYA